MRTSPTRLLAILLAGTACATDPATFRVGCTAIQGIQLSSGLSPDIAWSPDCPVAFVGVYEAEPIPPGQAETPQLPGEPEGAVAGRAMWELYNSDSVGNVLEPGVRYGRVPRRGLERAPAEPLEVGRLYLVFVAVQSVDGNGGIPVGRWGRFQP